LARARIYLTGRVSLEGDAALVDERHLGGRQGRLAFVRLAIERHQPVSRDRLVSAIWPDAPPREVDIAVGAILSKLRTAIKKTGLSEREAGIDVRLGPSRSGCQWTSGLTSKRPPTRSMKRKVCGA
jgi:DNA-binding SARP family transcriptional activator